MIRYFRPKTEKSNWPHVIPAYAAGQDREGSFVELRGWWLPFAAPFIRLLVGRTWQEDTSIYRTSLTFGFNSIDADARTALVAHGFAPDDKGNVEVPLSYESDLEGGWLYRLGDGTQFWADQEGHLELGNGIKLVPGLEVALNVGANFPPQHAYIHEVEERGLQNVLCGPYLDPEKGPSGWVERSSVTVLDSKHNQALWGNGQ